MDRPPTANEDKRPLPSTEPVSDAESNFPRDATEEEINSLPRIVDRVPFAAWAAALIGSAERFSYYAIISIWRMSGTITATMPADTH